MGRRLMYLWTILQKSEKELVRKVYNTQKLFPVKNDWVIQIQDDLLQCKIDMSDEEISKMKKSKFQKMVKLSIQQLSGEYLTKQMEKHTKSEKLSLNEEIQSYLVDVNTTVKQKKLLFLLRSRMFPVKMNFQQSHSDLLCSLCSKEQESQQHLLICDEIVNEEELKRCIASRKISYEDIYGPPSKQRDAIKLWSIVEKIRNRKLRTKENQV